MDAKEYLSQLRVLKEDIRRMEERIREVEAELIHPGTVRYDKLSVQTSPENQMEKFIIRKIQATEKLEKKKKEYETKYLLILNQIDQLKPMHQRILKLYYADGRSISEICRMMNYSRDWTYHLMLAARRDFAKRFLNGSNNRQRQSKF